MDDMIKPLQLALQRDFSTTSSLGTSKSRKPVKPSKTEFQQTRSDDDVASGGLSNLLEMCHVVD